MSAKCKTPYTKNTLPTFLSKGYNAFVQQNHTLIKRFSLNHRGRNFIAGDIHGCFDALNAALKRHDFDPATDRLFAVGDLIDRGPDSLKVIELLKQPWFHTCLGNHEEMLLNTSTHSQEGQHWFQRYGGDWWLQQDKNSQTNIRNVLRDLPLAIELDTTYGRVGIVHADIPKGMSWTRFIRLLEMGDLDTRKTAIWGRSRIKRLFSSPVKEIDRVVCGHSVTPNYKIVIKANVWFIETGAFLHDDGGHLSVINIDQLFE